MRLIEESSAPCSVKGMTVGSTMAFGRVAMENGLRQSTLVTSRILWPARRARIQRRVHSSPLKAYMINAAFADWQAVDRQVRLDQRRASLGFGCRQRWQAVQLNGLREGSSNT